MVQVRKPIMQRKRVDFSMIQNKSVSVVKATGNHLKNNPNYLEKLAH